MVSQLMASATVTFLALFPITHPIGAIPIFYSLTAHKSPCDRRRQARQVAINATMILAIFFLTGRVVLQFFGLSLGVLQIAGGLLVAQTAWKMLVQPQENPSETQTETQRRAAKKDISFVPMAVPLISGPGAIGLVITLATNKSPVGKLPRRFTRNWSFGKCTLSLFNLGNSIGKSYGKKWY